MNTSVTPAEASDLLELNLRAGNVSFLKGSPSTAKSSIVKQLAEKHKLKLIDLRLSQCEPPDLLGFPRVNEKINKSEYVPMKQFPLVGDPIPDGYLGWLIFLDEFNGVDDGTQKASYKLVLDRQHGEYDLHPNCGIIAAGNLETDQALVEAMSSAMKSRICTFYVKPDFPGFLKYMEDNNFCHEIMSYLEFKPKAYYTFNPDTIDGVDTYGCNRTWEMLNRQMKQLDDPAAYPLAIPLFASAVGEGIAREFVVYLKNFAKLPKIADILANPDVAMLPPEPGTQYAITGALAQNSTLENLDRVMKYVVRLPLDFQVITLRAILSKGKKEKQSFLQVSSVQAWLNENNQVIF
jgi:hypothetical protein